MTQKIAEIQFANADDYEKVVAEMVKVKDIWRTVLSSDNLDSHASPRRNRQRDWTSLPQQEKRIWPSYFARGRQDSFRGAR